MSLLAVVLDDCVASTDRDVTDSEVAFMATTKFEFGFAACSGFDHVDHPGGVLLKSEGFEPKEIAGLRDRDIHKTILVATGPKYVGVGCFTDFALKLLPGVGAAISFLFQRHFLLKPVLQTLVVDVAHAAITLAAAKERIRCSLLVVPTDLALNLLRLVCDATLDFHLLLLGEVLIIASLSTCRFL